VLREAAIDIVRGHDGPDDAKRRIVSIRRTAGNIVPVVPTVPACAMPAESARVTPLPLRPRERPQTESAAPGSIAGTVPAEASSPRIEPTVLPGDGGDVGDDLPATGEGDSIDSAPRIVSYAHLSPFQREMIDLGVELHGVQVVRGEASRK
jgi:hypothetical protein